MRSLRIAGDAALWLVAALGVVSALTWGATRAGWVQPLVVVSGSMEPSIRTGDLLVAVPHPTADLRVGDVASIRTELTGDLVTHRVVAVDPVGSGWEVRMRGDANDSPDATAYAVGARVWRPVLRVPGAGAALAALLRPAVAVPLGVALVALVGLGLLPPRPGRARRAAVSS